jgi:cardiolipin synthase
VNLRHLPNALTLSRLALAPALLYLLVERQHAAALACAAWGGISDLLDGWLAKRQGWRSALGGLLDPVADKAMLLAAFGGLWSIGAVPAWLLVLVLVRDLVILAGAFAWWRLIGPFKPAPSGWGKLCTLVQVSLVLALLLHLADFVRVPWLALNMLAWSVCVFAAASGLDYVVRYGRRAWATRTQ